MQTDNAYWTAEQRELLRRWDERRDRILAAKAVAVDNQEAIEQMLDKRAKAYQAQQGQAIVDM